MSKRPETREALVVKPGGDVFKSEKICLKVLVARFVKLQRQIYAPVDTNHRLKVTPPFTKQELEKESSMFAVY